MKRANVTARYLEEEVYVFVARRVLIRSRLCAEPEPYLPSALPQIAPRSTNAWHNASASAQPNLGGKCEHTCPMRKNLSEPSSPFATPMNLFSP